MCSQQKRDTGDDASDVGSSVSIVSGSTALASERVLKRPAAPGLDTDAIPEVARPLVLQLLEAAESLRNALSQVGAHTGSVFKNSVSGCITEMPVSRSAQRVGNDPCICTRKFHGNTSSHKDIE